MQIQFRNVMRELEGFFRYFFIIHLLRVLLLWLSPAFIMEQNPTAHKTSYLIGLPFRYLTVHDPQIPSNGWQCLFGGNSGIILNIQYLLLSYAVLFGLVLLAAEGIRRMKKRSPRHRS